MSLRRRRLLAGLLAMGSMLSGLTAGQNLPPITGELSGNLTLKEWSELPAFAWRVNAVVQDGATKLEIASEAPGLVLRIDATLPKNDTPGTWRVVEGRAEVAAWLPVVKAKAGGATLPEDLEMSGSIRLAGEGTWRGSELAGTITSTLENGSARSAAQDWEAKAIAVVSELAVTGGVGTLRSAQIRVGAVEAAGLVARDLQVDLTGTADGRFEIRRAELALFGGRVSLAPFGFSLANPVVEATAAFSQVDLAELARLVPKALAEAHGRMDGKISLRWSSAAGFELGAGSLTVAPNSEATVRLAATPGLLTQRMPPRLSLLPRWLGPLAERFAPENPAYDTLREIESGRQLLTVEKLRMQLYPDGPDAPRSAVVELAARPPAGAVVERVTFSVNVAGPLNEVLRLGLNEGVRVNVGAGP